MTYTLRDATPDDIDDIMKIEYFSFLKGIREDEEVFRKRVEVFPKGFIMLADNTGTPKGYFASEIWDLPAFTQPAFKSSSATDSASESSCAPVSESTGVDASLFTLNHDISDHHTDEGNTLYISSFALLPECRGSGMGDRFFNEAVARIRSALPGITQSVLIVNESWVRARAIYKKRGYEECGIIPLFFRPEGDAPQSAIIMRGTLA